MHIRERERGRDRQIERKMRKKEVLRIPQRCNRLGHSDSKQSPSFLFAFCSSFLKKTQTPIACHDCGTHSSPSTERQVHLFFGGSSSYRVSSVSSAFVSLLPRSSTRRFFFRRQLQGAPKSRSGATASRHPVFFAENGHTATTRAHNKIRARI
ncbi:hypothetical protein TGDOM2_271450 [Toxoplasma gondii GAB2-2007-GAL-DOM2]|uniref:Uncharacterized protein n=5 Tax=Toxoplasma gondii TaxID=5811 RepID=A0A086LC89_TOXGO|nr:hypothetical protein TGRH88_079950 [Toxoplasma gondii]KFG43443.1 hypothetical protein TGDOM2_271450 [Toxoplasma gondii GAB2-2007-GAL-DOM2]KFG54257.1 hypothetical protein TGFOU_271450 [Toxoplasma gondii FOU]PUA92214.1 hypothetical protein TGBR9_271450 [Toxoplasma gondii TgCATBr9]RQX75383.1 hypothetical protein TGCAST_271450 [Toxoplasma gondii CAST]